jgi:hypothetical protein
MKKFAFALLVTAIAACPAAAAQKKAKKEAAAEPAPMVDPAPQPTQAQMTNQNSANFAKDSLPVFLPSWSMPAYMAISKPPQTQPQR